MVDSAPEEAPDPTLPLTQQKQCGIWEDEFDFKAYAIPGLSFPTRSRIHHRYAIGAYTPGRHSSHLPGQCAGNRELGAIWWYGFSPWTDAFKARKLHISTRRDAFDRKHGFGAQHDASRLELEGRWSKLRRPHRTAVPEARDHRVDIAVARTGASRSQPHSLTPKSRARSLEAMPLDPGSPSRMRTSTIASRCLQEGNLEDAADIFARILPPTRTLTRACGISGSSPTELATTIGPPS